MALYPVTLKLIFNQKTPLDAIFQVANMANKDLELFSESSNQADNYTRLSYQVVPNPEQRNVFLTKVYNNIPWDGNSHTVFLAIYNEQRVFDNETSEDADIKDLKK